jgi:hypothetical protein
MISFRTLLSAILVALPAATLVANDAGVLSTVSVFGPPGDANSGATAGMLGDADVLACRGDTLSNSVATNSGWPTPTPVGNVASYGARARGGVLCAPALNDNPTFRAALSSHLDGAPVDYFDPRASTPTLAQLGQYDCVVTCVFAPYADPVAMGDVLADYVDQGGRVILGQFCAPQGLAHSLEGRIMTLGYCPVTVSTYRQDVYTGGGADCVHDQVSYYAGDYVDVAALLPGNLSDGTMGSGSLAVAWRPDRKVYYSPGNMAGWLGGGEWVRLTANICRCDTGPTLGACCDPNTGTCADGVELANCQPPLQFHYQQSCAALDPPCGNPGACCDEVTGTCTDGVLKANCSGRFLAGGTCAGMTPACGTWQPSGFLYAPAREDNPTFRDEVGARMGGVPTAYFDARVATPTLDYLMQFECIMTWADYLYADPVGMGNVLADYVDQGGRVILGQWCYPGGQFARLAGRIIDEPGYCPVYTRFAYQGGQYLFNGTDCVHTLVDVGYYDALYLDVAVVRPGALSDGTFQSWYEPQEYPAVAWRADRRVFYSPGNTGGRFSYGDWAQLTANMAACGRDHVLGACCNPSTGTCTDGVEYSNCTPPLQFHFAQSCAALNPPCGNPGACCDDATGSCTNGVLQANCAGRFRGGAQCNEFNPPCGACYSCQHSVTLWDSGGDGWEGNTLDVFVEGDLGDPPVLDDITLLYGPGPVTFYFQACTGSLIRTQFNADGSGPDEASYVVYDGFGNELCAGSYGSDCWNLRGNCDGCGDDRCNWPETCVSCPGDCGPCECPSQLPNQSNAFFSDLACTHCGGSGMQIRADGFVMSPGRHVSGVRFWGGYYNQDTPSNPDNFTVIFRADEGGLPGTALATFGPMPATTRGQTGMLVFGVHEYVYTIDVNVDLPGGMYWLELYNNTIGNPASWFWEAGILHVGVGVPGNAISYSLPESWSPRSGEAAFEIICSAAAVPGDLNCDTFVDFDDINPFVLALSSPEAYALAYPDCNYLNGDCNGDGLVDFDDINPFVGLLSGG